MFSSLENSNPTVKPANKPLKLILPFIGILLLISLTYAITVGFFPLVHPNLPNLSQTQPVPELETFVSVEDFKNYLKDSDDRYSSSLPIAMREMAVSEMAIDSALPVAGGGMGEGAQRVSQTNVQVIGVDEPDIVKTDGENIFISQEFYGVSRPMMETNPVESMEIAPDGPGMPYYPRQFTRVIDAFPPQDLAEISSLKSQGNLLLFDHYLLILNNQTITAFDVSDPKAPSQSWQLSLDQNQTLTTARLIDDRLYLLTNTYINYSLPCPLEIYHLNTSSPQIIPCTGIYHPNVPISVDSTFTLSQINPATGETIHTLSFIGSTNQSVTYLNPSNAFITYSFQEDYVALMYQFFDTTGKDLLSQTALDRLARLSTYELTSAAKNTELNAIINDYRLSLSADDQRYFDNEYQHRQQQFAKENLRQLETTAIVKIPLSSFAIDAIGTVPGHPLNQFSLDEYQDHLRIAVSISSFLAGNDASVNDVYILDDQLQQTGAVQDLGQGESIYSTRFVGETGYVVTFRQTDPFYVLDLSNPNTPSKVGELKIPGFSSYLHPLTQNIVLGVGQDNNRVKVSLFDVSNPGQPRELATYQLDEYYSEIQSTHHAFLTDPKHEIFFIPGSDGGYVFSYQNNSLELIKAINDVQVQRAVFLDDYLYIISQDAISVYDESTWQQINTLPFI